MGDMKSTLIGSTVKNLSWSEQRAMSFLAKERWCVLIADGYDLYREALCVLLSKMLPHAVVFGVSGDKHDPPPGAVPVKLVLLRLTPPYMRGFDMLRTLHRRFPITPIVLLSDVIDDSVVTMARARGACGFLHASASPEDLMYAINDVLAGRPVFPDDGDRVLKGANFQLSPRQVEVLDLLCKGMTNKEIGSRLRMSDNTVRTHVAAIFDILGVRNRTEAAMLGRHLL